MRRSLLRMVAVGAWLAVATGLSDTAQAQIASLVSPGPLSKAHASLEGAANCQKCHEAGKKVTADRCLTCHKPIALRIAARRGVHRDVTGDCVTCHVEHAGVDAELRPLDVKRFDHAAETGFALVGRHAPIAPTCVKCHKTRSFLTARPECRSCHADPHQGKLGDACATCHAMNAPFAAARTGFNHSKAAFPLTGAHTRVQCATCHKAREYRGLKFAACSDCHASPHKPAFPGACTSCHTDVAWKTTKVNHGATAFPLVGKHAAVECRACHKAPGTMVGARLKFAKCSDCHADPHRGQFKEDCAACHKETGFAKAAFDHGGRTAFPLTDRHAAIACTACHKRATSPGAMRAAQVSFKGLVVACSSCHKDPHAGELGTKCESCHKAAGFRIPGYTHTKASDFFGGQHSAIACAQCHAPRGAVVSAASRVTDGGWKFAGVATRCSTCHTDVHRGQFGDRCESCHSVSAAKFALVGFSHDKTAYPLSGKHAALQCASCHKRETGTFPAGAGTAVRFKGLGVTCASCHRDVHLGQLGNQCERCHATTGFARPNYAHAAGPAFFAGAHGKLVCAACHKKQEAAFPSGRGVAVRYAGFGKECSTCHANRHNGTLGGACQTCHTPAGWPIVSRAFHKAGQFPLQGKHLTVECASCHLNGVIKGTPTQCYACHWVRRRDDRYQTRLGSQCESCHTPVSWTSVRWNHAASSGVSLNAQHRALGCDSCHVNQQFRPGTVVCTNCHRADYDRTQAPNHAAAGFPLQCELCHRPSDARFSSAVFAHASAFPLLGVHATAQLMAELGCTGFYLSIGLTRQFNNQLWPIVIGVHPLPEPAILIDYDNP